eukprot:XP_001693184.1 predicted protein [Chlamydomonas reinhardtii]
MSNEEQEEELCALESIYGSEVVHVSREESLVEVCVAHPQGGTQEVVLRASLPSDYPASSPPIAELFGSHLSDDLLGWAARQMETMFTPGEVVLYQFVEWLKEQELLWSVPEAVREAEVVELLRALRVTSGEPHVEKKSTFQAHVAPVKSFEEVAADYDDDGETAAGGRLLHLLQAADVRNVVVVVSRWFGGVLMGPGRFTAINNTARVLLEQMGLRVMPSSAPSQAGPEQHRRKRFTLVNAFHI